MHLVESDKHLNASFQRTQKAPLSDFLQVRYYIIVANGIILIF